MSLEEVRRARLQRLTGHSSTSDLPTHASPQVSLHEGIHASETIPSESRTNALEASEPFDGMNSGSNFETEHVTPSTEKPVSTDRQPHGQSTAPSPPESSIPSPVTSDIIPVAQMKSVAPKSVPTLGFSAPSNPLESATSPVERSPANPAKTTSTPHREKLANAATVRSVAERDASYDDTAVAASFSAATVTSTASPDGDGHSAVSRSDEPLLEKAHAPVFVSRKSAVHASGREVTGVIAFRPLVYKFIFLSFFSLFCSPMLCVSFTFQVWFVTVLVLLRLVVLATPFAF